jgi:hypothetical protein
MWFDCGNPDGDAGQPSQRGAADLRRRAGERGACVGVRAARGRGGGAGAGRARRPPQVLPLASQAPCTSAKPARSTTTAGPRTSSTRYSASANSSNRSHLFGLIASSPLAYGHHDYRQWQHHDVLGMSASPRCTVITRCGTGHGVAQVMVWHRSWCGTGHGVAQVMALVPHPRDRHDTWEMPWPLGTDQSQSQASWDCPCGLLGLPLWPLGTALLGPCGLLGLI